MDSVAHNSPFRICFAPQPAWLLVRLTKPDWEGALLSTAAQIPNGGAAKNCTEIQRNNPPPGSVSIAVAKQRSLFNTQMGCRVRKGLCMSSLHGAAVMLLLKHSALYARGI